MAMLAELTHRCPLACPYCSNPLDLKTRAEELETREWVRVFGEAADLGVLHVHLSGGEPAARPDLVELTAAASGSGLYTNLITSGIGLNEKRMDALADAGLDHVQLSVQGVDEQAADRVGGYTGGYRRKMDVARMVRERRIPLTVNAVCHRQNMDDIHCIIDLAVELGARRLEVATVQFTGWATVNRQQLMPTRAQVAETTAAVELARRRLKGVLVIDYVPADYYATYPKACMGGWGRVGLNVDPSGKVLPCHAAEMIPGLVFDNVRDKSLAQIWYDGDAFNAFRGTEWMKQPCRTCERREIDFGGCRCQAMAIAGEAAFADPVCAKSPHRYLVDQAIESLGVDFVEADFRYRAAPERTR
ncbi:pyrroloquinoline quinone biosynthesis protein PqqE [Oricola cellulosilytica]|uniref:PqqA peptide cyclase n=1 Tax=Oricola cellulosilytica TaxID=1429082 RepID=A0A4R0P8Y4_9HYPH|nr:pyrroloquinoline quinone biosynthesis protein PqqE [Oricola cellulosilytica]TCD13522.1 pyrroloquinoline quinone biosynthesis protein PqqE [Oricola cellulosilytica]